MLLARITLQHVLLNSALHLICRRMMHEVGGGSSWTRRTCELPAAACIDSNSTLYCAVQQATNGPHLVHASTIMDDHPWCVSAERTPSDKH